MYSMPETTQNNTKYTPPRRNRLQKNNKSSVKGIPSNFSLDNCKIPWTEKQRKLIEYLTRQRLVDESGQYIKTSCAFISGVAGTSKTMCAVFSALKLLLEGQVSKVYYVRSAVDSSPHKLGFLKGGLDEKLGVYQTPLDDKLNELLPPEIVKILKDGGYVNMESTCYLRGRNLADCAVIVDESQNLEHDELVTIISRIAEHGRIWFCYDSKQSDLSRTHKNDMDNFVEIFNSPDCEENGFFRFSFTTEDIVRGEFCKFVMGKIEEWEQGNARDLQRPLTLLNEQRQLNGTNGCPNRYDDWVPSEQ